jgi:hypothetical protein
MSYRNHQITLNNRSFPYVIEIFYILNYNAIRFKQMIYIKQLLHLFYKFARYLTWSIRVQNTSLSSVMNQRICMFIFKLKPKSLF